MSSSKLEPLKAEGTYNMVIRIITDTFEWYPNNCSPCLLSIPAASRRGEVVGNPFIQELIYFASGTLEKLE